MCFKDGRAPTRCTYILMFVELEGAGEARRGGGRESKMAAKLHIIRVFSLRSTARDVKQTIMFDLSEHSLSNSFRKVTNDYVRNTLPQSHSS